MADNSIMNEEISSCPPSGPSSEKNIEKVTIYLSGKKVNEYQQKMKNCENVKKNKSSDKEITSLKRKKNVDVPTVKKDEKPHPNNHKSTSKRMRIESSHHKSLDSTLLSSDIKVLTKPPIPPKSDAAKVSQAPKPPIRVKKNINDANNMATIQKLLAQTDQMRLEITDLKTNLANEKNAVRVLRAQHDSDFRRVKSENKKLQEALQTEKKNSAPSSPKRHQKDDSTANASQQITNDILKLNQEISALKEANRFLEEKYHISSEAEKRKTSDIREQKDSYEIRLTQISKSAKNEIHRLLEELKSKDRNIGMLKKEILTVKGGNSRGKAGKCGAQSSQEMRKLKEIECNSACNEHENENNCMTNNKKNNLSLTTCGSDYVSMPHELPERIMEAHNDLSNLSNKENINNCSNSENIVNTGSDSDSALSSAPSSLSPQPRTCPNSPDVWRISPKENFHDTKEDCRTEMNVLQMKYDTMSKEFTKAKEHISDLEKALTSTRDSNKSHKLNERIEYLEQREEKLLKETHELREQNELLEFRIIELEESHDKWSLRSHSAPGTKDVWTDTEKEHDDLIMLSERSDSGVTSPNSHHHLDDHQSVSPCDLSLLDQIPTDDVRKRIITMSKRSCYDEEDKLCLLQILSLLNNLEALSQDHEITTEDISLEMPVTKYNCNFSESAQNQPPRSLLTTSSTPFKNHGKIVATVQPFSSDNSTIAKDDCHMKGGLSIVSISEAFNKKQSNRSWGTTSLQESGVFVDDQCSQSTQTELEDFPCLDKTNAELCAEIEKLNKFREKIEECTNTRNRKLLTPNDSCDKKRLQYYIERLQLLENKVLVYESSGDLQMRRLAERLQREVQLENWVKQLSEKIEKMEAENLQLEEERCELEEIENDTRLRLQRLEIDLEVMNQRNIELEMSRNSYQSKFQDAKDNVLTLEECLHKCEERIFVLEEHENDLKHRLELITSFIPVLLLYNTWQTQEAHCNAINYMPSDSCEYYESSNNDLQLRLNELLNREKELTQNITELNRAYNETLENADNLWAQMEKEYKDKITKCEAIEINLKSKISQLEQRLSKDSDYAHERISHLEDAENSLKNRISKLSKENKELAAKHNVLLEEYAVLKDDYKKLQNYLKGPVMDNLEREKRKIMSLEEELSLSTRMLKEVEEVHRSEVGHIKGKLMMAAKELTHIEVTNSELREEVETLESRIRELLEFRNNDDEKVKQLSEELQNKQSQLAQLQQSTRTTSRSLAQELERPVKGTYSKIGYEIHPLNRKFPDHLEVIVEDKQKFPITKPETKEVKSLAETIIMNAENRATRAQKKSFVEEARSRFARWV